MQHRVSPSKIIRYYVRGTTMFLVVARTGAIQADRAHRVSLDRLSVQSVFE